jgi:hypothetical protein
VPTPQPASEVGAAVASAHLCLHGFYGGCKGTPLFRPLAPAVGSVLPSGAGVSGVPTVGNQLPKVTGRSPGCGSRGPPEAYFPFGITGVTEPVRRVVSEVGLRPGGVLASRHPRTARETRGCGSQRVILSSPAGAACRSGLRARDGCRVASCRTPRHAAGAGAVNTDPRPQRHRAK